MGSKSEAPKGKLPHERSSHGIDYLTPNVADLSLPANQEGDWELVTRKNKNRAGSSSAKQWPTQTVIPRQNWKPAGKVVKPHSDLRGYESRNSTSSPGIAPPLEHGWNWAARAGASQPKPVTDEGKEELISYPDHGVLDGNKDDEDEDDAYSDDDDDDDLLSDDSDVSSQSHGTRKNHRMLKAFFEVFDKLSVDEINEPARQWHCPACQGGPGAIEWYRGLQPLFTHARTKGSKRMKLHREFAELLDEELRRRGTFVIPAGESFGQWEGLKQETRDHEIVWPPMVIIMNTKLERDENERWIGMGNQELLDYFGSYHAVRARHSYGPQGHRGMSVLIFESSAVGFHEAERLHKHFLEQGTGRDAWDQRRVLFYPGGKRQLYGFLAEKEDMDMFNQHSQGKSRLKFDMRSYHEMVVSQMEQMREDNQQLAWFKNKVEKVQRRSETLEESLNIVSEKLRITSKQNRIVRERTKMQHEQNKEEMVFQEQFFKDQIKKIQEETDAKEDDFEKLQQEERKKVEQSNTNASSVEDYRRRAEEVMKFIKVQDREMEEFVAEREMLIETHEGEKVEMKKRHWEEVLELEKKFDAALTKLMEKYAPGHRADDDAAAAAAASG